MMDIKELTKQAGAVIQHIPMCVPEQVRFIFSGEDQLQEYTRLVLEEAAKVCERLQVKNLEDCHEADFFMGQGSLRAAEAIRALRAGGE
jgi:hypothetical protein